VFKSVLAWLAAGLICVGAPAAELQPVRTLAGITEYKLDNGLQLLLMPVPGSGRTFVTVTYKVGSRMEGPGEAGMAHLLEHVTFRGTRDEQGQGVDLGIEIHKLAPSANGHTTQDLTNYSENFVPDVSVLRHLLALEAQRMQRARLDAEDFEKEKPIVLNEMGMRGEQLSEQMSEALHTGAFARHPYRSPVIGTIADIEHLQLATLRAFYEKFYRPDNAVLMIAGEFDEVQTLAAVQENFGVLPRPATPISTLTSVEPPQAEPRVVTLHTAQTSVAVGYHVPNMADPQAAALMVWSQLMALMTGPIAVGPSDHPVVTNFWQASHDPTLVGAAVTLRGRKTDDARAREALAKQAQEWAEGIEHFGLYNGSDERQLQIMIEEARSEWSQALRAPGPASERISTAIGAGDWRLAYSCWTICRASIRPMSPMLPTPICAHAIAPWSLA